MCPAETIVLAGPTGAGKTELSLRLAEHFGGEIVGADAFQIYAGLPLLTAQPTPAQRAQVFHHLIGSVDPLETFDASRYQRTARPILHAIAARDRIPIVVGGTGLYLKALLGGLDELPGNDPVLRQEFARSDLPTLVERLRTVDEEAAGSIDLANRRRVERALEIILLTGRPLAVSRTSLQSGAFCPVRGLFILRNREELYARIKVNVTAMFAAGVESEVSSLPEEKTGPTAAMALGLREIRALLRREMTRDEAMAAITTATCRYAKRQITWFRKQHAFPELNLSHFSPDQALAAALRMLEKG